MNGEDLPPHFDTAFLDCDGDGWRVVGEVIGRAASARATIVRTPNTEASFSFELRGPESPLPPESVFQRFETLLEDPQRLCTREGVNVVVEAFDAAGRTIDCVAWGDGAADVVSGEFDSQLAGLPHGDWATCRVR